MARVKSKNLKNELLIVIIGYFCFQSINLVLVMSLQVRTQDVQIHCLLVKIHLKYVLMVYMRNNCLALHLQHRGNTIKEGIIFLNNYLN